MKKTLIMIFIMVIILIIVGIFLDKKVADIPQIENTLIKSALTIQPSTIYPGDPILINVISTSTVKEILFDSKQLSIQIHEGKTQSFLGIDFNEKNFEHNIKATLANGEVLNQKIILTPREKIERPLGIPDSLGGNTSQAEKALLANLAKENLLFNSVKTSTTTLWTTVFTNPLSKIFITDDYGYDRKTVNSTIVHKGTDFRASVGTSVMAMNDGIVRISKTFIVYGNTIVIDHGLGIQSLYMHLSKLNVKEGDTVKRGQIIGFSGKTGYAESPHLHISIKINKISIDPITFLGFFK